MSLNEFLVTRPLPRRMAPRSAAIAAGRRQLVIKRRNPPSTAHHRIDYVSMPVDPQILPVPHAYSS